jgi:hypothetical protein
MLARRRFVGYSTVMSEFNFATFAAFLGDLCG